ncbi:M28 family metallopeptidase [Wenzhouxiangella sp. XN24]|uniref:M28 family metallopeptidase n=1 Tax=Wenzhouxiangella sp. XN24 TaxID=2713569 RepID=UPI0013EAB2D2|nr:M28 family metallopeptidase [Wenzhouxiangella sp. XN24]NGX16598.1 M28 family peptidase [Wenzhouxiangella sp. XN24]
MKQHTPRRQPATRRRRAFVSSSAGFLLSLAGTIVVAATPTEPDPSFTDAALHRHIGALASDAFGGRFPGTPGEVLTLDYLEKGFAAAGAQPAYGDSYRQAVPLVSWTFDPAPTLSVAGPDFQADLEFGVDMIASTGLLREEVTVQDSPLVFAGYGIVAPEYGWNDYAGLDVRGKTVVVLVNDPGFATGDPALFTGRAMTYYGRWTYKFEEAARQGAAAVLVVHEDEPASYGWEVIAQGATKRRGLRGANRDEAMATVEGWLSAATARRLCAAAGEDFDTLKAAAQRPGFRARALGELRATARVQSRLAESDSYNIVAVIPGSERPEEVVLFTAHWDHLGRDGAEIYNGAVDNASGTAGLLVLAEAYAKMDPPPARSIAFVAVTAEEQGLLGSAHYAAQPAFPLENTVAVINIDGLNYIGPTRDISVVGYGASELDEFVDQAAAKQGRKVLPDQRPEAGSYYRSDHFNLAKRGVPALYPRMGLDLLDGGTARGKALSQAYNDERYHKPADEYSPTQDWRGGALDLLLYFDIGRALAMSSDWPNWTPGNEFRAIRDIQRPAD